MNNPTDNQELLLIDDNDNFLGKYAKRVDCHRGNGLHHRAVIVLLKNHKGQVLLQKRKHALFDGYWDISATTHVLHINGRDESYEEAAKRALIVEMGLEYIKLQKLNEGFNYFATESTMCENEYCTIYTGFVTQEVVPNVDVVYETKWVNFEEFIHSCKVHDSTLTPWAILTGLVMK